MAKRIIILNGSPRAHGNTAMLCEFFAKGAESAGHNVNRFDLGKLKIHGCIGCMKGGKDKASPCTQKDDMTGSIQSTKPRIWLFWLHPCIIGAFRAN